MLAEARTRLLVLPARDNAGRRSWHSFGFLQANSTLGTGMAMQSFRL